MGFLTGGPYYDMIGRTGNNVGRKLRGKNVFSMRPSPSHKPPTPAQLNQRLKVSLVGDFLSWITPTLKIGFQDYTAEMSAYNAAVSYNLQHAVTGVSPNFSMDYAKVLFSRGKLYNVAAPEMSAIEPAELKFTWTSSVYVPYANADDQVSLIVFNPEKWSYVVQMNAALRSAQAFDLQLPVEWGGDEVNVWFMVVSTDGKMVSNTYYMGETTLIA